MVRKKKEVLKALSSAHLRAIGSVAAHWNLLELTLLWAISKIAKVSYSQAIIMAGAQNAEAWCAMLQKMTGDTKRPGPGAKPTKLDKLTTSVQELHAKRNEVVHASWHPRTPIVAGLLSATHPPSAPPKGKDKASGTGIPKRGKKVMNFIDYTSSEILAISNQIEKIEQDVYEWLGHWQKVQREAGAQEIHADPHPPANDWPSLQPLQSPYLPSTNGLLGPGLLTGWKPTEMK